LEVTFRVVLTSGMALEVGVGWMSAARCWTETLLERVCIILFDIWSFDCTSPTAWVLSIEGDPIPFRLWRCV